MTTRQPFDGVIIGTPEQNALRLVLKLSGARSRIRNAQSKPVYLQAATDEWDVLRELDAFAAHIRQGESDALEALLRPESEAP
jgi:hypothetical protein